MTTRRFAIGAALFVGGAALGGSAPAAVAQAPGEVEDDEDEVEEEAEDVGAAARELGRASVGLGKAVAAEVDERVVTLTGGLGVEGYLANDVRDAVGSAFLWEIRANVPLRGALSLEAAYLGSGADIDAPFGGESAALIGTTFEATAVWRGGARQFRPFGFAGLGWRNLQVVGGDFSSADDGVADSDSLVVLPVGVGVGYRRGGLYADGRATLRFAGGADLVRVDRGGPDAMHAWALTVRAGVEL